MFRVKQVDETKKCLPCDPFQRLVFPEVIEITEVERFALDFTVTYQHHLDPLTKERRGYEWKYEDNRRRHWAREKRKGEGKMTKEYVIGRMEVVERSIALSSHS